MTRQLLSDTSVGPVPCNGQTSDGCGARDVAVVTGAAVTRASAVRSGQGQAPPVYGDQNRAAVEYWQARARALEDAARALLATIQPSACGFGSTPERRTEVATLRALLKVGEA